MGRVIEVCACGESMETLVPDGQEPTVRTNWLTAHTGHQRLSPDGRPIDANGKDQPVTRSTTVPEADGAARAVRSGKVADVAAAVTSSDNTDGATGKRKKGK